MRKLLPLLLVVYLQSCSEAKQTPAKSTTVEVTRSAAPREQVAPLPKVVFLGDSLSAGLHLSAEQAFPAVLQRKLSAKGVPFQLLNAGVSGDTTTGGLRRSDWLLSQKPDIVVIELGANDGLRGQPLTSIRENLQSIIAKVRAAGALPLLLGIRLPPSHGPQYVQAFDALYAELAEELKVEVVPFFMEGVAGVPELNLEDGLHPTKEGHERLANNVAPKLEQLLRKVRSPAR